MATETALAWAAGFFDGEGCVLISVAARSTTKHLQTSLVVSVVNTDRRPIDKFSSMFAGWKGQTSRVKFWLNPNRRLQYEWSVRGLAARDVCAALLPYSVVKREQLAVAVEFYTLPWRSQRRVAGGGYTLRTAEQVLIDVQYAQRLKELKRASAHT